MSDVGKPDDNAIERAAERLRSAEQVVVFTGAGISAESGIGTFRDAGGFWERFPPEQFAHWSGLMRLVAEQPGRVVQFLLGLIEPMLAAQPNPAHRAIAALEAHKRVTVITQNIDGLHVAAGSSTVYAVHGNLYETIALKGGTRNRLSRDTLTGVVQSLKTLAEDTATSDELLTAIEPILCLQGAAAYRPHIVMFGDMLAEPDWTLAQAAVCECDCVLSIGTSGMVYPAAMLPERARAGGAAVIGVDPSPVEADIWIRGRAGEIVPRIVEWAYGGSGDNDV